MDWFEIVAGFFGMLAVSILATANSGNLRKGLEHIPVKKICWAILIAVGAYWYITVPYIRSYFDSSNKLEFAIPLTDSDQSKHIRNHETRIDRLEREVKETKEDLQALQKHYRNVVQVGWFAVLYLGLFLILGRKRDSSDGKFNLDSYKQ